MNCSSVAGDARRKGHIQRGSCDSFLECPGLVAELGRGRQAMACISYQDSLTKQRLNELTPGTASESRFISFRGSLWLTQSCPLPVLLNSPCDGHQPWAPVLAPTSPKPTCGRGKCPRGLSTLRHVSQLPWQSQTRQLGLYHRLHLRRTQFQSPSRKRGPRRGTSAGESRELHGALPEL